MDDESKNGKSGGQVLLKTTSDIRKEMKRKEGDGEGVRTERQGMYERKRRMTMEKGIWTGRLCKETEKRRREEYPPTPTTTHF